MRLFDFLFPPRADELTLRELESDGLLGHLQPRLVPETRPATVALLPFSTPAVRAALHEAKYHGSERAFTLLAEVLADYLVDLDEGFTKSFVIVPVPLGRARLRERGFNQVEEVARRALRALDIGCPPGHPMSQYGPEHNIRHPVSDIVLDSSLLTRTRETPTQVSLARDARERNLRGAFSASHPADPHTTYLLLDDVITTGATLQSATSALLSSGAEHILPLALAH